MNTEFEKYAREQFDGHEVEVDTDALWTNVYPHVKKEKGNRRVIWFFLFGLLAGIVGISLFNYTQDDPNSISQTMNTTANTTTESTTNSKQSDLNTQETTMSIGTIDNTTSDSDVIPESDFTKVNTSTNNTAGTLNDTNTATKTAAAKTVDPVIAATTIQARQINQDQNIQTTNENPKFVDTQTSITAKLNTSPLTKQKSIFDKEESATTNKTISTTNKFLIEAMSSTIFNQKDESIIPQSQHKNALDTYTKNLSRLKKGAKKLKVGLGIYGGISKATTDFSAKDSIGLIYEAGRNTSEKQLETIHLGFDVSVYSKKNIYLRSGAEYTRIASVFNFNSELITTDSTEGIKEIIINNITGETDTILGQVPATTTTQFVKKHYNYIHLIDIPVIVGYQFEYAPWSIGIEGGIYANISAKYTGEISSLASDAFYDLEEDENKWFKTNVGIQPYIGLNAAYNVSDNFQIHFSPGFRFETLFSTDKNPVVEKHSILGLKAGVRYIFD